MSVFSEASCEEFVRGGIAEFRAEQQRRVSGTQRARHLYRLAVYEARRRRTYAEAANAERFEFSKIVERAVQYDVERSFYPKREFRDGPFAERAGDVNAVRSCSGEGVAAFERNFKISRFARDIEPVGACARVYDEIQPSLALQLDQRRYLVELKIERR